jgi:outer membrane protein assembly factor BamB
MKKVACALLLSLVASTALAGAADDILKAAGIRGGLVVVIGCDDPDLITRLHARDAFVVQALDADPAKVERARAAIRKTGGYGRISVMLWDGKRLPYAGNLVNLLVTGSPRANVQGSEIRRVLAPRGVHVEKGTVKYRKPVPSEIDDWTHYLHSPNNNAVAQDRAVGPPRQHQWIAKPRFSRSHDHLASVTAAVSAKGRLFSVVDEGSIAFLAASPRWKLIAQDAFNGIRLWERSIKDWEYHLRDFRSGPADVARRLVAVEDTVYVTLGYEQPVIALDAATGQTVKTYEGTAGTREILCSDNTLFLVLGEPHESWGAEEAKRTVTQNNYLPPFEKYSPPAHNMRVASVSVESGKINWTNEETYTRDLMPATLTLAEGRVFFHTLNELVCLDAANGKLLWKAARPIERRRLAWSSPTVVAHDGIVYAADRAAINRDGKLLWLPSGGYHQYIKGKDVMGKLIAYDAKTGKPLWECDAWEGFNSAVDIFIADGLLWTGRYAWGNDPGITQGRDPKTGEVKRTRPSDMTVIGRTGHARCHRAKATSKYLIVSRRGVDMVDIRTGKLTANFWVRGICAYGVLPANGLIYTPPHSCACSVTGLLKSGYVALAPAPPVVKGEDAERLLKGPAFAKATTDRAAGKVSPEDWPTYRSDPARNGSAGTSVRPELRPKWAARIGGTLTPPVVAGGMLLVAAREQHAVHALDAESGEGRWDFTAGGRIDSPPTIVPPKPGTGGPAVCLFGSADGHVYCLRLADGQLVWRYRAAPRDRLITVDGQIESAWPVSGSVLVIDGTAYFAAGRTSFLDGGMFLHGLEVVTGKPVQVKHLEAEKKKRDSGSTAGLLPDVLASNGESIFMRGECFSRNDLAYKRKAGVSHLWSSVGFLDHNWWHRTYWQYGTTMGSGWGGWHRQAHVVPVGRLLVTDGTRVYGYGRSNYDNSGGHVGVDGRGAWGPVKNPWTSYHLFGRDLKSKQKKPDWAHKCSVLGQALVLAGKALFIAGPEDPLRDVPKEPSAVDVLAEALESDRGGRLLAVSPIDGKTIAQHELDSSPVFDGMIAAQGRLYLSTRSGKVICMEAGETR